LVLNQKEEKMKFNKCVIIKSKMVNKDYILLSGRDMEDIIKNKITASSGDNHFTNMGDVHTCPIRSMNLFMAGVVIMHSELVKIPNIIGGAGVSVPIIIVTGGNSSPILRHTWHCGRDELPKPPRPDLLLEKLPPREERPRPSHNHDHVLHSHGHQRNRGREMPPWPRKRSRCSSLKSCVLLKAQELSVHITRGDGIHLSNNRGENWVLFFI
jgi:hypothetical protein